MRKSKSIFDKKYFIKNTYENIFYEVNFRYLTYIYAIICPVTNTVVYIGKTKDIRSRFTCHRNGGNGGHLAGLWCKAMKSIGYSPIFKVLDFTYGAYGVLEDNYIDHFRLLGQCQFNIRGTSQGLKTRTYPRYFNNNKHLNSYQGKLPVTHYKELFKLN